MASLRTTPTSLRFLILSALGASFSGCGAEVASDGTEQCTAGNCPTGGTSSGGIGAAGGLTGGGPAGGAPAGGAAAGGAATGGRSAGGDSAGGGSPGGTGGSSPGGAPSLLGCTDPKPLMDGADTGIFRCAEGYLHRQRAEVCPTELPRDIEIDFPDAMGGAGSTDPGYTISRDDCSADTDCGTNAYCVLSQTNAVHHGQCEMVLIPDPDVPDYARICISGCRQDADCADDQVCVCSSPVGHCQTISESAGCHEDADCQTGDHCLQNARLTNFSTSQFACQLPADTCQTDQDCEGQFCLMSAEGKSCEPGAVCGRPFLIFGVSRTAELLPGEAWLAGDLESQLSGVVLPEDPALRAALAAHWTRVGLLEHASIAAFARFTLQLLSLGASAELVEAATRAQADEARHARLAFALAGHYAGEKRGPGPLPLQGTLEESGFDAILRTTILEGCMGETRAALEASRGAERCEDPIVRQVLETIAADEARHAELAWKVVRWMTAENLDAWRVVAEELSRAEERERSAARGRPRRSPTESSALERFGVLDQRALEVCHQSAHRDVIAPCARTLLAMTSAAG